MNRPNTFKPAPLPEFAKIEVDGAAGVGKTHLFGTLGKGKKMLMFDVEGGSVTYSSPTYLNDPLSTEPSNIDIVRFPTEGPDKIETAQQLAHLVEGTFDWLIRTKNSEGYSLVVMDSLTEFQKRFLSLHKAPDPRQSYGALSDALYAIVLKARAAPVHVAFTSRPKVTRDEVQGKDIIRSDVAPSVWSVLSGLLDAVGYYSVRSQGAKTTRTLDFNHDSRFQAKNRYGMTELVNPTMASLLEVIQQTNTATVPATRPPAAPPRRVVAARPPATQPVRP